MGNDRVSLSASITQTSFIACITCVLSYRSLLWNYQFLFVPDNFPSGLLLLFQDADHQGEKISSYSIIKIGINFIFRLHRRPIQLVVFDPVGLSSFLHLRQVLLGVEVSSVAELG